MLNYRFLGNINYRGDKLAPAFNTVLTIYIFRLNMKGVLLALKEKKKDRQTDRQTERIALSISLR